MVQGFLQEQIHESTIVKSICNLVYLYYYYYYYYYLFV